MRTIHLAQKIFTSLPNLTINGLELSQTLELLFWFCLNNAQEDSKHRKTELLPEGVIIIRILIRILWKCFSLI
jgi:hypothetical protein